jgi:DNA-binding FadR family transcriptional regulator
MNDNIKAVVDSAFTDNATQMRDALYNEINDRIFDAIEQKKQALAQNLITQHYSNETNETETEE